METLAPPSVAPADEGGAAAAEPPWARRPELRALAGASALLVALYVRVTVDDAFITWRYGRTLVEHGTWSWNPTGPRVEAYTNPLFAVAGVVPAGLGVDVEVASKLAALATLVALVAVVHRLALPRWRTAAVLAVTAASPVFLVHLFAGLETAVFALLVVVLFASVHRHGDLGRWGAAAALALSLTRPEGVLFALVGVAWAVVVGRRSRDALVGAGVAGVVGATLVVRLVHFGRPWPSAYYVKSDDPPALSATVDRLVDGAGPLLVAALVAGAAIAVGRARRGATVVPHPARWWSDAARRRELTPVVLAVTSTVVVVGLYCRSALEMDYATRFGWQVLFPVLGVGVCRRATARPGPVVAASALAVAALVVLRPEVGGSLLGRAGIAAVAVAAVLVVGRGTRRAVWLAPLALAVLLGAQPVDEHLGLLAGRYRLEAAHGALGDVLGAADLPGSVAVADAGLLPYRADVPVLDPHGLGTAAVTRPGGLTPADLEAADVTVVVALSASPEAGSEWAPGQGQQVLHEWMRARGFVSTAGPPWTEGYWLNVWIRPDLATPALVAEVERVRVAAVEENLRGDAAIVGDHLLDLPFP